MALDKTPRQDMTTPHGADDDQCGSTGATWFEWPSNLQKIPVKRSWATANDLGQVREPLIKLRSPSGETQGRVSAQARRNPTSGTRR
jgi:hypothetical protein